MFLVHFGHFGLTNTKSGAKLQKISDIRKYFLQFAQKKLQFVKKMAIMLSNGSLGSGATRWLGGEGRACARWI